MKQQLITLSELPTILVEAERPAMDIILLHGYAMQPEDLAPFAHSMGINARFFLPTAPLRAADRGYSWWSINAEARLNELSKGPRDLAQMDPPDRREARLRLINFCEHARQYSRRGNTNDSIDASTAANSNRPLIVCGFSQGGMLACDAVLCGGLRVDALALLSSSRAAIVDWLTHTAALANLPVFVSHGRNDQDLAFSAGEALKALHEQAGAQVTWVPFDGSHEIPLLVWRELRKFVRSIAI